jgi:hypothetical protein
MGEKIWEVFAQCNNLVLLNLIKNFSLEKPTLQQVHEKFIYQDNDQQEE